MADYYGLILYSLLMATLLGAEVRRVVTTRKDKNRND